jgi:hypothetical protein
MTQPTRPRGSFRRPLHQSLHAPLLLVAALAACDDGGGSGGGAGEGGGGSDPGAGGGGGAAPVIEKPNRFRLRLDDAEVPDVVLELDKAKALEVFGEDGARQITILNVDSTELLRNAVTQIQNACGTSWQLDNPNPNHNCLRTPLGQSFGASWQTSPEFALVRLLSMTPANANVTGTSLADFKRLIDGNPTTFRFTFGDVLAESLGIPRTAPFVPTPQLIQSLQQQLIATHPAISDPQGVRLPVSLYEALLDLTPLAQKLGPAGEHPGVLVPDDATFTTRSNVLLPDFRMRVVAQSALRRVSGIDLSTGGGDLFVRVGDAPLRFDFDDPQRLQITGIAPNPTVDMRFSMRELGGSRVPSCTVALDPGCKGNSPTSPVGTGTIWTVSPFLLEPIVTKAAYLTYGTREFTRCYFEFGGCQTGVDIGQSGDPLGWTVFTNRITFSGQPPLATPEPQFLWELLTEVAQVSVHDPTGDGNPDIPEGSAEPVYTLRGVGIGLTADQLIAELRPTLQGQAKQIAEIILGRYWLNSDPIDFYYDRIAPGGDPYLFFVSEDDLRPDDRAADTPLPYAYEKPGFFSSPDLDDASKLSTKEIDGIADTTHEKLRLSPGENTLYAQDDEGTAYEIRFYVPRDGDPVEITADVKRL